MKKNTLLIMLFLLYYNSYSQLDTININNSYDTNQTIYTFTPVQIIYGLRISGSITYDDYTSLVRVILVNSDSIELLIYEAYPWLYNNDNWVFSFSNAGDETYYLDSIDVSYINVEIFNAKIDITTMLIDTTYNSNIPTLREQYIDSLRQNKIDSINNNIQIHNLLWLAGDNDVAQKTYNNKKKVFSNNLISSYSFNTFGEEYFMGGVFSIIGESIPSPTRLNIVESFDWRNRHGKNWISPVKDQDSTNFCVGFSTVGALESIINLYYNNQYNKILSEQAFFSCMYGIYRTDSVIYTYYGSPRYFSSPPPLLQCDSFQDGIGQFLCKIKNLGALDSSCYTFTELNDWFGYDSNNNMINHPLPTDWPDNYYICKDVCANYENKLWKIDSFQPILPYYTPDILELKEKIILNGPVPFIYGGHSMLIVGFAIINEGDTINNIIVSDTSNLIGHTYFIVKDSQGANYGYSGYKNNTLQFLNCPNPPYCPQAFYSIITPITPSINSGLTVDSIKCNDNDGDGYFWWGIGEKPNTCPIYSPNERDCDDSYPLVGPYDNAYNCTPICEFDNSWIEITTNTTIEYNQYLTTNIKVKNGYTLKIMSGATLYIHPSSQIVVESGGILYLDNGNIKVCSDAAWQGSLSIDLGGQFLIENESEFKINN